MSIIKDIMLFAQRRRQRLGLLGHLGVPSYISGNASFAFHENIKIGRYCRIGRSNRIDGEGGVQIGDGCMLGPEVTILSSSHNYLRSKTLPYDNTDVLKPVIVGNGVWIGWGAMVMPGSTIADGAIVAAGAVVSGAVGEGEVVAGNPARIVKLRENHLEIQCLINDECYFLKSALKDGKRRKGRERVPSEIVLKW